MPEESAGEAELLRSDRKRLPSASEEAAQLIRGN